MIRVLRIDTGNPLYSQETRLREDVLLRAVGYDFPRYTADYPYEHLAEHFVAVLDHPAGERVIGCALLRPADGKVMQVAVDPQFRGQQIGTRLMTTIESRAFGELPLRTLFCHAQLTAAPFYDRLGWQQEGDVFTEAGIPHVRMVISAPSPAAPSQRDPDPPTTVDGIFS